MEVGEDVGEVVGLVVEEEQVPLPIVNGELLDVAPLSLSPTWSRTCVPAGIMGVQVKLCCENGPGRIRGQP